MLSSSLNKPVGFLLLIFAYGLLYPGLSQPMLTVTGTIEKSDLLEVGKEMLAENQRGMGLMGDMATVILNKMKTEGTIIAFDKTRSILGTVRDLFSSGNVLVAILIMTFSVVIPLFKGFITLISLLDIQRATRGKLGRVSALISKWSMADVFVIAIFVAYLAANGIREDTGLVAFESTLGSGFYFFLGYCLVSILASQMLAHQLDTVKKTRTNKRQ
ncbi:MAG: paraquat-inducible protein A [Gammaproteobacteria bacterium]|nr:paraquat-inducible protein A [Gammaproteobacteria bacterium]